MRPDGNKDTRDPEARGIPLDRRKPGPRRQKGFVERATAEGHSGYGVESVRPHLRDQLKLKALMAATASAILPEEDKPGSPG